MHGLGRVYESVLCKGRVAEVKVSAEALFCVEIQLL